MIEELPDNELRAKLDAFRADFERLRNEVSKVIVGHLAILDDTLIALIAGGHVLLEGVPGLGKTLTVRTLADAFRRVGSLRLAGDLTERDELRREHDALRADGFAVEWIEKLEPPLDRLYHGAIHHPPDGALQPAGATSVTEPLLMSPVATVYVKVIVRPAWEALTADVPVVSVPEPSPA